MAIQIDWGTHVITVPKADTTLVDSGPPEIRSLDVEQFRLDLKALEDDEYGMSEPDILEHYTSYTISGVTYAHAYLILAPYTVTFENGSYVVVLSGENNNIQERTNLNNVQTAQQNSAGLQTVISGSGVTEQDKTDIIEGVWDYERV